jgi:hypothetical protein
VARAFPRVPLVVLTNDPSAEATPATVAPSARAAAGRAVTALGDLHGLVSQVGSRHDRLADGFARTVEACRDLAGELAQSTHPVAVEELPARLPIHEYFGVRQAVLSPQQAAANAATVVYRGLADLRYPLVDINDMAAEIAAMRLALADLIALPAPDEAAAAPTRHPEAEYQPSGEGLERWIVAHHVYFLFNLRAAAEVHAAIRALRRADGQAAAGHMAQATHYVRGFSAAMAHSAAMPAAYYAEHVRHTMGPPHATVSLTGGMQPQHKAFRSALRRLLEALPDEHGELALRDRRLATTRAALLDADLIDIERHAHVADKLVGSDHSLVQREDGKENAVSMLRTMRHLRAAKYAPLMPYGDHLVMAALAAMTRS